MKYIPKEKIVELGNCECGKTLKYYDSLEEYLQKQEKIDEAPGEDELFSELLNSLESNIAKIILYCVKELPFPLGIKRVIEVLRGTKASFIIEYNLNQLYTYSVLSYLSKNRLERYINALIEQGFLKIKQVSMYKDMPTLELTVHGSKFLNS